MNKITHPVNTAFEDLPEEGVSGCLGNQSGGLGYCD
jgi:hypothetical protein